MGLRITLPLDCDRPALSSVADFISQPMRKTLQNRTLTKTPMENDITRHAGSSQDEVGRAPPPTFLAQPDAQPRHRSR